MATYTDKFTKRNTTFVNKFPQKGQGGFGRARFGTSIFGQPALSNKYSKRNSTYSAKYA